MRFSHFFVDRPIFATVLSIFIVLIGGIAYTRLPVSQFPEVAPPTVVVSAQYPGASAEIAADSVASVLEQEINGVENMLFMSSNSNGDGNVSITVTFRLGTDLDQAQVLVQNRVAIAEPRLPDEVKRIGVTTRKNSTDFLMVVHLYSPDRSRDQLYISNYATLQMRDTLARLEGVGEVRIIGARDYAMRVWIDPDRAQTLDLTAADIVSALRSQNLQVASGVLNAPPSSGDGAFQINVQTLGRLNDPEQFADIIVKSDQRTGAFTRLRDVARVELGAQDYVQNAYFNDQPAIALGFFLRPGSNALEAADRVLTTIAEFSKDFPTGVAYSVTWNPTAFVQQSVDAVIHTIFEAIGLVILVVLIFLQSWRASLIPILAIPISLIGTFAVMAALGYTLNNLTLFGLVLAIGIVVDDAIVVVENVERNLRDGKSPRDAAHATMTEVGGALVAIALVLSAVFIPTAFIEGISGQFYRQFAVTIAVATAISCFVSLTLSPALSALLLKPHVVHPKGGFHPLRTAFGWFNKSFDFAADKYGAVAGGLAKRSFLMLVVYAALIWLTVDRFGKTPRGFVPQQDQAYLIAAIQLPPGATLSRTDAVVLEATRSLRQIPGVKQTAGFAGFSGATFTNNPATGAIFFVLDDFEERAKKGLTVERIMGEAWGRMSAIPDAFILVLPPPTIRGIGNGGGFKMMVQDRTGRGLETLKATVQDIVATAATRPEIRNPFTLFETDTPQLYADIDRTKAQMLGLPVSGVFDALSTYLGSTYVNDFNYLGRTYRVTAQADATARRTPDDVARLRARNANGSMVPIGSVANFEDRIGTYRLPRYNLYPAAEVQGDAAHGISTGQAIDLMEKLAAEKLPPGFTFEWTDLALQEKLAGNTANIIFALAVLFVFLILAAQYESWTLPLAIILIVPLCLLAAVIGLNHRGLDNNILSQIGFVVLVGLACKNAILIVEFAKQLEDEGVPRIEAARRASALRLRPILMTSLAFILGVLPLVFAKGAGAEMRQALGTAVFAGMLGVTLFGLFLTPTFYVICRGLSDRFSRRPRSNHGA